MKKCPYCAEEIQDDAIKCKHCGEMLKKQTTKKRFNCWVKNERGKKSYWWFDATSEDELKEYLESKKWKLISISEESVNAGTTICPKCQKQIVPVVTSVGGGSCSVGRRDKFYCPLCQYTLWTQGCFIATAAYENANAAEVLLLRDFRDKVLKESRAGKCFIEAYYCVSPTLSKIVEKSRLVKWLARKFLDNVVWIIKKRYNL